jgi:hypothetical protein
MVLAKSLNYQWFSKMFKNIFMTILWNFRTCIIFPGLLSPLPTSLLSWFCGKVKKSSHFICKHFSTSCVFTLTYCDILIIFFTCHYFTTHQPTQTFTFSSINYFLVLHNIYIFLHWRLKDIRIYLHYITQLCTIQKPKVVIQTYYYCLIQWKCYLVSSDMWTYGVFSIKRKCFEGLASRLWFQLNFSHILPYITKAMLSPPHLCICARFCAICRNLCIAPNFPIIYNVHKKFHV